MSNQERPIQFLVSSKDYFHEVLSEGFESRRIKTHPAVQHYLVNLLEHYLDAKNLDPETTLAEMYLQASNLDAVNRISLLKQLGDRSLYISGFFGDSLNKKLVDVDYYANLGGAAYSSLASVTKEDVTAKVYKTISERFLDFVDVLTVVSQKSLIQSDQSILRLYDKYLKTGSQLAKEKLLEMGVLSVDPNQLKKSIQD